MIIRQGKEIRVHVELIPAAAGHVIAKFFGFLQSLDQRNGSKDLSRSERFQFCSFFPPCADFGFDQSVSYGGFAPFSEDFCDLALCYLGTNRV